MGMLNRFGGFSVVCLVYITMIAGQCFNIASARGAGVPLTEFGNSFVTPGFELHSNAHQHDDGQAHMYGNVRTSWVINRGYLSFELSEKGSKGGTFLATFSGLVGQFATAEGQVFNGLNINAFGVEINESLDIYAWRDYNYEKLVYEMYASIDIRVGNFTVTSTWPQVYDYDNSTGWNATFEWRGDFSTPELAKAMADLGPINVVSAPIPEPSSALIGALGLLLFLSICSDKRRPAYATAR